MFQDFGKEIEKLTEDEARQILLTQSDLYDSEELKLLKEKANMKMDSSNAPSNDSDILYKIYNELLEIKLNQIKSLQQFNYIKSINAKLTFFTVLVTGSLIIAIVSLVSQVFR